jgi:hypothetical protein
MIPRSMRTWSLAGVLALTWVAYAGDTVRFDVKPGLWETTSSGTMTGAPQIPDEVLQKLPPERREQALAAMQAAAGKPMTRKTCLTEEKVAQGFNLRNGANCQQHVISNTASELNVTGSCSSPDGSTDSYKAHFVRVSREEVTGNISVVMSRGGHSMNVEREFKGKWLAASCGDVKD